jgi:prevent-host-death family protein
MIEATASDIARAFHEFLDTAQHGETVLIRKHGKAVARLVPDSDFMDGKMAASLFRSYKAVEADKRAADAIEAQIRRLDQETEDALAH